MAECKINSRERMELVLLLSAQSYPLKSTSYSFYEFVKIKGSLNIN